jgi:hypothetical protein
MISDAPAAMRPAIASGTHFGLFIKNFSVNYLSRKNTTLWWQFLPSVRLSALASARTRRGTGVEPCWGEIVVCRANAAVVFKTAGNRLDRLYRQYNAWLIIPLHDAFIFGAPLERLGATLQTPSLLGA